MSTEVLVVGSFFPSVVEDLQKRFTVHQVKDAQELAQMDDASLANVQGLATNGWAPADVIDRLPALKLVSSFGVGYDGVAADHAAAKGIIAGRRRWSCRGSIGCRCTTKGIVTRCRCRCSTKGIIARWSWSRIARRRRIARRGRCVTKNVIKR